jgi:hypothetical protein
MRSRDHLPSELAPIDEVQVVPLQNVAPGAVNSFMDRACDRPCAVLRESAACKVAALWRELPPGEQARCHIPPLGVRFLREGRLVLEASVCWKCNNIFGSDSMGKVHCKFDASAPASQALLFILTDAISALNLSLDMPPVKIVDVVARRQPTSP